MPTVQPRAREHEEGKWSVLAISLVVAGVL